MLEDYIQTLNDLDAINRMAHEARRLCNDIIRQTSLKPYYGKRGGAAVYAAEDMSEAQRRRLNIAIGNMRRARTALYHAAVSGGIVEAKGQIINAED